MEKYELYHHGILGMKWGVRRYQNKDGTWTAAGKKRYSVADDKAYRAKQEAVAAKKIASKYTDAMDKKAAKRQEQADSAKRFKAIKQDKADRAKQEAVAAKKIASKYTDAMDKKAAKRQEQANEKRQKKESYKNLTPEQQKQKMNELATKMYLNSSFRDSMLYNRNTYEVAARYIVKDGFDKQTALSMAKNSAWATTGGMFIRDYAHYKL